MEPRSSPTPSPPSSGLGLKGFMTRFRKNGDNSGDRDLLTAEDVNWNGPMLSPGSPSSNGSSPRTPPKDLPAETQNWLRKGPTKRRRPSSPASTHSFQERPPTPPSPKNRSVREDHGQLLVSLIDPGIPREGDHTGPDGIKRRTSVTKAQAKQAKTAEAIKHSDSVTRFLNALHAYLYSLATTASLGIGTGAQNDISHPPTSQRDRRTSGVQQLFDWPPVGPQSKKSPSASLSDYGHILNILVAAHEHLPIRALFASVPMLLVLDDVSKEYREREPQRYNVLQEVLARVWLALGETWNCAPLLEEAGKVGCSFSIFRADG